jgi:hypothetical protein
MIKTVERNIYKNLRCKGCLCLVLLITFCVFITTQAAQPNPSTTPYQYYVDPNPANGSDSHIGTVAQPYLTIQKALQQIVTIKNNHGGLLDNDVQIILRAGTYYTNPNLISNGSSLVLDSSYSGNNGMNVYIQAYPGETPVLSGGQKVGTVPVSSSNGQWTSSTIAGIQSGSWYFKRLRVGNNMAVRARYPAFEKNNPYTGGELFNDWCGKPWEKGTFNFSMQIKGLGAELDWNNINTQFTGSYTVWVRYASAVDASISLPLRLTVDSTSYSLSNLISTGGLNAYSWVKAGTVLFTPGAHTLHLQAIKAATINIDALILTSDKSFDPKNTQDFIFTNWDGSYTIPKTYSVSGVDMLVIQAEAANNVIAPASYPVNYTKTNIPVYSFQNKMCFATGTFPNWSDSSWKHAVLNYFPATIGPTTLATITSEDTISGSITTDGPEGGIYYAYAGDRFYIENVKEALNNQDGSLVPNEWYLDKTTGVLYYNAPVETASQDVVAPRVNTILKLQGTNGSNISNIIIDGVTFMDTDFPDYNKQTVTNQFIPPASNAVELDFANNITIRNSNFTNLGSYAIGLENSSYHNFIYSNTFNNLGGGAIGLGYNSNQDSGVNSNVISFNNISNIGRVYRNETGGVVIQAGSNNLISNNNISNASFAGVFINAGWGYHSFANSIEYNTIVDTVQESNDMGPLYETTNDNNDTGTVFKYNFLKNTNGICSTSGGTLITPCLTEGIYLDTNASGVSVYGNVVENASNAAISSNSGSDLDIENNIFYNPINTDVFFADWNLKLHNITITNNIFARSKDYQEKGVYVLGSIQQVTQLNGAVFNCLQQNNYFNNYNEVMVDLTSTTNQLALQNLLQTSACGFSTDFQAVLGILLQAGSPSTYFNTVDNNLYSSIDVNPNGSYMTSLGPGWSSWTNPIWTNPMGVTYSFTGYDTNSIVNQDPLFVNSTNDYSTATDFTLQPGSPQPVGFQPIPLDLIGNTGYPTTDQQPVFTLVPDQTVSSGQQVQFTVSTGILPNNVQGYVSLAAPIPIPIPILMNKSLALLNPPSGAVFSSNSNNTSGTFTWTPPEIGDYEVGFLVEDTLGLADTTTVNINVTGNEQYYWPLNDGSGTVAHEQTVNLNDAHLYFNWACSAGANCPNGASGWTMGPSGNSLLFNTHYADHAVISNDNYTILPANNAAFSIALNFKANSLNALSTTAINSLMTNETYQLNGFRMGITRLGALQFWNTESGGILSLSTGNNTIIPGQSYQVVVSYDGSSATLYLNGQAIGTGQGIVKSSTNDLHIGWGIGGSVSFDGMLGGLRIYNKALLASDVNTLFNNINNINNLPPVAGLGDVNGDTYVSLKDAELTAQDAIGLPVAINTTAAKVDGKAQVDIYDAFLIAQYVIGNIADFPPKKGN